MDSIFLPARGCMNIYHFLVYMVSNLRHINFIPNNIYLDISDVYFTKNNNHVLEILYVLYPNANIYNVNKCPINCISVFQDPGPVSRESGMNEDAYTYLRKLFIPILDKHAPLKNYSEHIYISRIEDSNKRRIMNENDLLNNEKFKCFQKITPSKIPLLDQMYIFYKAKTIISIHGAALVNILFCNTDCKIIEIATEQMTKLKHFEHIAITLKLDYKRFTKVRPINNDHYESDILLNSFDII
jgi:capsular polysaccharide biosynthesis protein